MKKYKYLFVTTIVVLLAFSSSHPPGNTGAPGDSFCANCHTGNGGALNGEVSVMGFPSSITPNTTYPLTITVTNPAMNALRAGFQIVVLNQNNTNSGTISNNSSSSSIISQAGRTYLGHAPAKLFSGQSEVSWTTDWTAPSGSAGDFITVYGASVIANGNGANSGDRVVMTNESGTMAGGGNPLSVSAVEDFPALCHDSADGVATATASGGQPPYDYLWDNNENTAQATSLLPGNHSVTVTDQSNATATTSVFINAPGQLFLSVDNTTDVFCYGENTGTAQVSAFGGSPNYTFSWSDGFNGSFRNNLFAGFYTVTVTDNNGCTASDFLFIDEPEEITGYFATEGFYCAHFPACLYIIPSGGTGNYQYLWDNGSTMPEICNLGAGTYTVTVTDANNCSAVFDSTLIEPPVLLLNIDSISDNACYNQNLGYVLLSASGGFPPYDLEWSDGYTEFERTNMENGNYSITLFDSKGCEYSISLTINEPTSPVTIDSLSGVPPTCAGSGDGSLSVATSGGTGFLTTTWSTGFVGNQLLDIDAGTYSATVTDDNGCMDSITMVLSAAASVQLNLDTVLTVRCYGDSTGSAKVTLNTPEDYVILWSTGFVGDSISNLPAGIYTASASNAEGCISNTVVAIITQPDSLQKDSVAIFDALCFGDQNGRAELFVTGGQVPYRYFWSNGDTLSMADSLNAGPVSVMVVDSHACSFIDTFIIGQPAPLMIDSALQINNLCFGDSTGMLSVFASGGNDPYQYNWSNGMNGSTIANLPGGPVELVLTDSLLCRDTSLYMITSPPPLTISFSVQHETEKGAADGSIRAIISGGSPGYTYIWSNGQQTDSISGLSPGVYQLEITDNNGCMKTASALVNPGGCILTAEFFANPVSCFGAGNGSIAFTYENGLGALTILLNGEPTDSLNNLLPGLYTVTLTDSAGCSVLSDPISITQPLALNLSLNVINASGPDQSDGAITANASGGTPGYVYLWSTGDTSQTISDLLPNDYSLTVTDGNGCIKTSSATVEVDSCILDARINLLNPSCFGANDGSIDLELFNAQGSTTILLNGMPVDSLTGLDAGMYELIIKDSLCEIQIANIELASPEPLSLSLDSIVHVENGQPGKIFVSVIGGSPSYTYVWRDTAQNIVSLDQNPDDLAAGTYFVEITDSNGCTASFGPFEINIINATSEHSFVFEMNPNPFREGLRIRSDVRIKALHIIAANGSNAVDLYPNSYAMDLDLEWLPPGIYLLRLFGEHGSGVGKLVKY